MKAYLRELICEVFNTAFWGKKVVDIAVKWVLIILGFFSAFLPSTIISISVEEQSYNASLGTTLSVMFGVIWLASSVAVAVSKCPYCVIRFDNEASETHLGNFLIRVHNDGLGYAEICVQVVKVVNEDGTILFDSPVELDWDNLLSGSRPKVTEGIPAKALMLSRRSKGMLHAEMKGNFYLIIPNSAKPVPLMLENPSKNWLKLAAKDERGKGITQWFCLEVSPGKTSPHPDYRVFAARAPRGIR